MKGKLIVIESGSDASGKATQSRLLLERLMRNGHRCMGINFPDYGSDSSALVKMYLGGEFGKSAGDVNAYAASTFYAVDRYASYKTKWGGFLEEGGLVIADRYTTSNMVHQASKIEDKSEKIAFIDWLDDLEFVKMGLPRPDMVIFLDMPVEKSFELMESRPNKIDGSSNKDIHESDKAYLEKSYKNALWVCEHLGWRKIECVDEIGELKSVKSISDDIAGALKSIL
jgi:dTMP kinase